MGAGTCWLGVDLMTGQEREGPRGGGSTQSGSIWAQATGTDGCPSGHRAGHLSRPGLPMEDAKGK